MVLKRRRELGIGNSEVLCYAFAPPPVFGPLQKLPAETRRAIRAFVFGNDMVCRLSLASAYGLFRDLKEIDAVDVSGLLELRKPGLVCVCCVLCAAMRVCLLCIGIRSIVCVGGKGDSSSEGGRCGFSRKRGR